LRTKLPFAFLRFYRGLLSLLALAGIGLSLLIAALLAIFLKTPMTPEGMRHDV
jgi:hypothetical protein